MLLVAENIGFDDVINFVQTVNALKVIIKIIVMIV